MDDDELIELINKRYDELQEHGFMEDMDREEHEAIMFSIAQDIREMEGRERYFIINPPRYRLACRIYRKLCFLLDSCDEEYEIYIREHFVFSPGISIVALTPSFSISSKDIATFKEIMSYIDGFLLWPGDGDRVRMSFDIRDVYIEIGEDGDVLSMASGE